MVKQIRLTEEGLKQLIRESVRQSMNEAGWRDKFNKWGRKMQNKTANWFNGKKYDDEYSNHSSNNLTPDEQQEYDRDHEELRNTTPYPYSSQPHSVNMDDWNEAHSEEGNGNSDEDSPKTKLMTLEVTLCTIQMIMTKATYSLHKPKTITMENSNSRHSRNQQHSHNTREVRNTMLLSHGRTRTCSMTISHRHTTTSTMS